MAETLNVISAGAAQSVVQQIAKAFKTERGIEVAMSFGAVGAQKEKLLAGTAADVIVLTQAMIDDLITAGHVVAGSRHDLGAVGGAIAVRKGAFMPNVSTSAKLAEALRRAGSIYIPDPDSATAGKQFVAMCETLGIGGTVRPKLKCFPNGFSAMTAMAKSAAPDEIGCTQITEIKLVEGVTLVSNLPHELQRLTTYSLGIVTRSAARDLAATFVERLTGAAAAPMLSAAGFVPQ
jgi:molybdate transport system substrate-binding protein